MSTRSRSAVQEECDVSDFDQPGGDVVVPGPAQELDNRTPPSGWYGEGGDVLQPAPTSAPRRVGRTLVAATLAALLVLVAGGAAYGWTFLHRPDVALARAFDATKSAASGDVTVSVSEKSAAPDLLAASSLRYAWGPGTQQVSLTLSGKLVATVVTTDTHLTVQADLASTPLAAGATDQLRSMAALLGPDGQVLLDLADGKPVGVSTGPGSALRDALGKASGASSSSSSSPSPDQVAAVVDAIAQSIKDDVTVTAAGTDPNGDHFVVTIPMSKVAASAWQHLASLAPGLAAGVRPDLSSLDGVTLTADAWVRDGAVRRIEVPLGPALDKVSGSAASAPTLVVVLGSGGVTPPPGPISEVPDSLIRSLTGNG